MHGPSGQLWISRHFFGGGPLDIYLDSFCILYCICLFSDGEGVPSRGKGVDKGIGTRNPIPLGKGSAELLVP
jgi:hypothetical protein